MPYQRTNQRVGADVVGAALPRHDEANRATVRAVTAGEMPLVGFAVHGPKNGVDKALKGLRLHP